MVPRVAPTRASPQSSLRFQGQSVAAFYTPHGGSLHFPPGSPAALAFIGMEKVLARFTDGLIFESDYIRREYERRVGAGLAPTAVITNGLQPSDFGTHEPRADAADFLLVCGWASSVEGRGCAAARTRRG